MTERTKNRMRRTWDVTKAVTVWGLLLGTAHQAVDLRGKWQAQQEREQATADAVAQSIHDIATLAQETQKLKTRVSRLERPSRSWRSISGARHTGADSVTARSPGLGDIARNVVTAPFRLLGFVFGGK